MPHRQKGRFWRPIASASTRPPHLALQAPHPYWPHSGHRGMPFGQPEHEILWQLYLFFVRNGKLCQEKAAASERQPILRFHPPQS